jgi:dihydrofolate reductase
MNTNSRKLILFIAMSLDGYIATPNGDLSFLTTVEQKGEDYGYNDFIATIDTVIMGRKTYDKVRSMGFDYPHADKISYIITRKKVEGADHIKFFSGNLADLISKLKGEKGKNIFCDGGAEIVNLLMKDDLIDEYIISIIPIFLGDGIALFKSERPTVGLKLVSSKSYKTGLVQLHYQRKDSN